jgi:type I restriction enzyme S subunit
MENGQWTVGRAAAGSQRGEVPPGYKHTEVGVIPEDWEVVSFSELMGFRNGVNADKSALHTADVPGRIQLAQSAIDAFSVEHGDVLFNRTSETQEEVGLSAVFLGEGTVVFGGFVIRGRMRGNSLDPVYSGYALRSPWIRAQVVAKGQGAVRANIGQQALAGVTTPLPPLPEQRAIAAALSDVDALLTALDRLSAKKRAVKTAAMQQLLTGRQRLPGFSGTWETKRLGEIAAINMGQSPSSKFYNLKGNGLPLVQGNADIVERKTIARVWTTSSPNRLLKNPFRSMLLWC